MLIRRSLVSINDDLVPVSRRVFSRQFMETHEALNIRVVLVQHIRETREESSINTCEILRLELRVYIEVAVRSCTQTGKPAFCPKRAAKRQGTDGCAPEQSQSQLG